MPKTADFIEETKAQKGEESASTGNNASNSAKRRRGNPDKTIPFRFKPGQSGNPSGRPKNDLAAQLAREVIEGCYESAKLGLAKQLRKGNAYTFKELAERGYGKLKETKELHHIHEEVPDADLNKRIAELERELGLAAAIDEAGRVGIAATGTKATNGAAKDHELLPR